MPSSLGLYIEDNLIKYAKVSKDRETIKVESFGVKFLKTVQEAIKQIIEETYSFKTPINVNTDNEWYNEIQVFNLLGNKDRDNVIKTEFENICYEREINQNIYEQRYMFSDSGKNDDKTKVIHVSVPKTAIEQRKNQFSGYKVNAMVPLSIAIANLVKMEKRGTIMVVNIEKETTLTKITNGLVSGVEVVESGVKEILDKISQKENSYSKAYEICKNTTIYTGNENDSQYEENEYLEDIMPTLFQIVSQIRKAIDESIDNIDKIYITGTGTIINNVDIYFQDYLRDVKCEILKPNFINNNSKINIKDYIEVNSAIAIAMQGLEKGNKDINFRGDAGKIEISSLLSMNVLDLKNLGISKSIDGFLGRFNRQINVLNITFILITIVYLLGVIIIDKQFENKIADAQKSIDTTNSRISKLDENNQKINDQTQKYMEIIADIQGIKDKNSEDKRHRNTIPNLLNKIMVVIPVGVQLTSIENSTDTHIIINAQSKNYQEIAYFKAKLQAEKILENVVSDTGTLTGEVFKVIIEGELP